MRTASASIDPAALSRLRARATGDAPDFYDEMLAMFLGEIDKRLAAIMESLSHGELEVVERAAHSLGGSAKLFGADRLGELCGRLQAPPASLADARVLAAESSASARASAGRSAKSRQSESRPRPSATLPSSNGSFYDYWRAAALAFSAVARTL